MVSISYKYVFYTKNPFMFFWLILLILFYQSRILVYQTYKVQGVKKKKTDKIPPNHSKSLQIPPASCLHSFFLNTKCSKKSQKSRKKSQNIPKCGKKYILSQKVAKYTKMWKKVYFVAKCGKKSIFF